MTATARPGIARPGLTVPGLDFQALSGPAKAASVATVTQGGGGGRGGIFTPARPGYARPGLTVPGLDTLAGGASGATSAATVTDPRDGTHTVS